MKIAYFLDTPKGLGGAGNLLLQRAALMSEIHDIIVVIPSDRQGCSNEEYIRRCINHKLRYVCMEYSTAYSFVMIDFNGAMEAVDELEQFAIEEKIDFFHSVQLNLAVEYVSRKLGIPHLMDIYSIRVDEFKFYYGDLYPHFHLCDSQVYSDVWQGHMKIESRCIRPVAPLDDIKIKPEYDCGKIKILSIGNVCSDKNQLTAIKACLKCRKYFKNIELHILGYDDGSYAKECKAFVEENRLENMVFFHGFISNVEAYLQEGNCLLCTSTRESFPLSMVEALTYDLTIISTPVAGVPEVFADKENAFISSDFSEQAIAESILECIEAYKNGKVQKIHKNARKAWMNHFERKVVRKQIDAYYAEIKSKETFHNLAPYVTVMAEVKEISTLLDSIDDLGETWIHKRGYYYLAVQRRLKAGKMYIWGAGKWGKAAFNILNTICPNVEIIAFIDNHKSGFLNGIPIKRIDEMEYNREFWYSVSFCEGREEAMQYLQDKGLEIYGNIWNLP